MLGKRSSKEGENIEPQKNNLVTAVAEQIFRLYGNEFARYISGKISERFEEVNEKIKHLEMGVGALSKEVEILKAMSNDRIKDIVKSVLEVQMEVLADKAAERAISKLGVDTAKRLTEDVTELKKTQIEITETLEIVSELVKKLETEIENNQKGIKTLFKEVVALKEELSRTISKFNEEISKAVADTTEKIKDAVAVDRSKIESVLKDVVGRVVNTKMSEISDRFAEITEKYDEIGQNIGRIIDLAESVSILSEKVGDIERELRELSIKIEKVAASKSEQELEESEEDEVNQIARNVKEEQNEEVKEVL